MEEEIGNLRAEEERSRQVVTNLSGQVQKNETELRSEENRLNSARRELGNIREKKRTLEAETEPEPADVRALVYSIIFSILYFRVQR